MEMRRRDIHINRNFHQKTIVFSGEKSNIIIITEPDTPLNDADHVGSFFL